MITYKVYYGTLGAGSSVGYYTWKTKKMIYDSTVQTISASNIILNPVLTREANQAGSFEADIPYGNIVYNDLQYLLGVISIEKNGEEIWQGRITNIDTNMDRTKHIYCEGDMSYLNDCSVKIDWDSVSITETESGYKIYNPISFFNKFCGCSITQNGKSIDTDIENDYFALYSYTYNSMAEGTNDTVYTSAWNALFDSFLDGLLKTLKDRTYIYMKRGDGYRAVSVAIAKDDVGSGFLLGSLSKTSQSIEYGVNLTDITVSVNLDDIVTRAKAYGYSTSGWWIFSKTEPISVTVSDSDAISKYGIFEKAITVEGTESTTSSLSDIASAALKSAKMATTITVRAVDMASVDMASSLEFLKVTKIVSASHGINDFFVCTKLTEHLDDFTNSEFVYGSASPTFSNNYVTGTRTTNKAYTMGKSAKTYLVSHS